MKKILCLLNTLFFRFAIEAHAATLKINSIRCWWLNYTYSASGNEVAERIIMFFYNDTICIGEVSANTYLAFKGATGGSISTQPISNVYFRGAKG